MLPKYLSVLFPLFVFFHTPTPCLLPHPPNPCHTYTHILNTCPCTRILTRTHIHTTFRGGTIYIETSGKWSINMTLSAWRRLAEKRDTCATGTDRIHFLLFFVEHRFSAFPPNYATCPSVDDESYLLLIPQNTGTGLRLPTPSPTQHSPLDAVSTVSTIPAKKTSPVSRTSGLFAWYFQHELSSACLV